MGGHASRRLLRLRVHRLFVAKEQTKQPLALHGDALKGGRVADESIARELYDRLCKGNFTVQSGGSPHDPVFTHHCALHGLTRGKTYDQRDNRARGEIDFVNTVADVE